MWQVWGGVDRLVLRTIALSYDVIMCQMFWDEKQNLEATFTRRILIYSCFCVVRFNMHLFFA